MADQKLVTPDEAAFGDWGWVQEKIIETQQMKPLLKAVQLRARRSQLSGTAFHGDQAAQAASWFRCSVEIPRSRRRKEP